MALRADLVVYRSHFVRASEKMVLRARGLDSDNLDLRIHLCATPSVGRCLKIRFMSARKWGGTLVIRRVLYRKI